MGFAHILLSSDNIQVVTNDSAVLAADKHQSLYHSYYLIKVKGVVQYSEDSNPHTVSK